MLLSEMRMVHSSMLRSKIGRVKECRAVRFVIKTLALFDASLAESNRNNDCFVISHLG